MRASPWALSLLLGIAGCGNKTEAPAAASASASAPAPPPPARGLGSAGTDPTQTAFARKVLEKCSGTWKPESGFDSACAELKVFVGQRPQRGTLDATFIAWLEDPDPKVRTLGARGLAAFGDPYRSDRALAERVVAVAENEKEPSLTGIIGFLAGEILVDQTGLLDRIRGLLKNADGSDDLKIGVISILLQANRDSAPVFDLTREVSNEASTGTVRSTALSAFSAVYDLRPDDVCKLWVQNRENADEIIAAGAAARLTTGATWVGYSGLVWSSTSTYTVTENRCAAEVEPTLNVIEARAKAGKIAHSNWIFALRGVLRDDLKKTPPAQKKRALALAKLIAETRTNNGGARGTALRLIIEKHPDAKAIAKGLSADPDIFVRNVAMEINSVKP
ncbi:MAG: hypothetical protein U0359_37200 [Byssovorax sp.]